MGNGGDPWKWRAVRVSMSFLKIVNENKSKNWAGPINSIKLKGARPLLFCEVFEAKGKWYSPKMKDIFTSGIGKMLLIKNQPDNLSDVLKL